MSKRRSKYALKEAQDKLTKKLLAIGGLEYLSPKERRCFAGMAHKEFMKETE